ncbi:MAG: 50S ribosomal protein L4 [Actinomycetota bacterium]|nr:50S ribosomal protein L4 [Actinomycetota bacterium]
MSIQVRSQSGDVVGQVDLDERVFGAQVNVPLMHQVVRAQLAAARAGTHSTKTRADVSGGGKKPWRQKGTGRARQGSTRAPHWLGGGVAFGPKPRDHSMKVPKKMRANSLRSALSDRAKGGAVHVVESLAFEVPKTADAVKVLESFEIKGNVLLVLDTPDMAVGKSFRNLSDVHITIVSQLNTYDVLDSDAVLFTRAALDSLSRLADLKPRKSRETASRETTSNVTGTATDEASTPTEQISSATTDEMPSVTPVASETIESAQPSEEEGSEA